MVRDLSRILHRRGQQVSFHIYYTVAFDATTGEFWIDDAMPPNSDQPVWDTHRERWLSVDQAVECAAEDVNFDIVEMTASIFLYEALKKASK